MDTIGQLGMPYAKCGDKVTVITGRHAGRTGTVVHVEHSPGVMPWFSIDTGHSTVYADGDEIQVVAP